jgi:hypothetical protein
MDFLYPHPGHMGDPNFMGNCKHCPSDMTKYRKRTESKVEVSSRF